MNPHSTRASRYNDHPTKEHAAPRLFPLQFRIFKSRRGVWEPISRNFVPKHEALNWVGKQWDGQVKRGFLGRAPYIGNGIHSTFRYFSSAASTEATVIVPSLSVPVTFTDFPA